MSGEPEQGRFVAEAAEEVHAYDQRVMAAAIAVHDRHFPDAWAAAA